MRTFGTALIIDDDKDLCMLVKAMLVNDISDVHCVHSIEAGREILTRIKPDVVLLDNNLPDGQGIQFISEIKSVSPGSKIILISAFDNLSREAMELGAHSFLEKPLSYTTIRQSLSELG